MKTSNVISKSSKSSISKATSLGHSFKMIENVRDELSDVSQKAKSMGRIFLLDCLGNQSEKVFHKEFGFDIPVGDRNYNMEMRHHLCDIEHIMSNLMFDITCGYYKRIVGRSYRGKRNIDFPEIEHICKISDDKLFPAYAACHRKEFETKGLHVPVFAFEWTKYTKPFKKYSDSLSILLKYYDEEIIPDMKQLCDDFKNMLEDINIQDFLKTGSHYMNRCCCGNFGYSDEIGYIQSVSFIQIFNMIGLEKYCINEKREYLLERFYSRNFSDKLNGAAENSEIVKKENDFCTDILTKDIHEFPFLFDMTSTGMRAEKQLSDYGEEW